MQLRPAATARMDSGKSFFLIGRNAVLRHFLSSNSRCTNGTAVLKRRLHSVIERAKKFWISLAPIHYPNTEEQERSSGWLAGFKTRFGIKFRALGLALLFHDCEYDGY